MSEEGFVAMVESGPLKGYRKLKRKCQNCGNETIVTVSPRLKNVGNPTKCEKCPKK